MTIEQELQTDNHASTPPLSFLQAGCLSCRPTNSVKALKAMQTTIHSCRQPTVRLGGVGEVDLVDDRGGAEVDGPPGRRLVLRLHVAVRVGDAVVGQLCAVVAVRAALERRTVQSHVHQHLVSNCTHAQLQARIAAATYRITLTMSTARRISSAGPN